MHALPRLLATRSFTPADQHRFAGLSGDRNPIHVDPVRARRTLAGQPVVHGIHLLLAALDLYAGARTPPMLATLRAQFSRFVHLAEAIDVQLVEETAQGARLIVRAGGVLRCDFRLGFGPPGDAGEPLPPGEWIDVGEQAMDLPVARMAGLCGHLAAADPAGLAAAFPAAAGWIGAQRLAALAASTRLVGMVCPGLHSVYTGLRLDMVEDAGDALAFAVGDVRHRLVPITIRGGGIAGRLESFARQPPAAQPGMADLAGLVPADAFAGQHALVIGGSRGLGELAAKLVATGGGHVTLSYRVGRAEAEAVAADIRGSGGSCDILPYEVGRAAAPQLAALRRPATHAYFFATPVIARPNSVFFDRARFDALAAVFVDGFHDLATALAAAGRTAAILYPSTVYVAERPKGMAEYAMAKAAGEILCEELNVALRPLRILAPRLPRLATDQTADAGGDGAAPNLAALLPLVRQMQALGRSG